MALSLGIHPGAKFRIGPNVVEVMSIGPGAHAELRTKASASIQVVEDRRTTLFPDVFVSFGRNSNGNPSPRLCFEAPKKIPIVRL